MHIHFDAIGGAAGDMIVASLLDAFPDHRDATIASVAAATVEAPVSCRLQAFNDGILQGRRFHVSPDGGPSRDSAKQGFTWHDHTPLNPDHGERHGHSYRGHPPHDGHAHRHWSDIRAALHRSGLQPAVRDHAVAIFEHLARAEAAVHGIDVEHVAFHEVGAWDSIADIVAAAHLIVAIGAATWSVGPLPLGSGRIMTAHGSLPVPAPATAILLRGFATIDDGIAGERVTPTGAAILRHLCGATVSGSTRVPAARVLGRSGTGFGMRTLPGLSNCIRLLAFDETAPAPSEHRELAVIEFEVDDQSAEDLAMGLDRLREHADILDAVQMPVFGKKGRMMTHVRLLARVAALDEAITACFRETTTIGLRHHVVSGAALVRRMAIVEVAGREVRVKTVERPGGRTAKAEADDALTYVTHTARAGLRRDAERIALTEGEA